MPCARSRSSRPTWPGSSARRSRSVSAASAPTVVTPAAASRASARGPTPGSARTGNGARNAASVPGRHDGDPAGLAPVGRDLRDDLRRRDAERAGEARRRAHGGLHRLGDRAGAAKSAATRREVEVALVEPGALDAAARPRARPPRRPASTRGRARAAAARRPPPGSGAAPRRSSSPSGCRSGARRSSRSRRRRARAGRRRRRAAAGAAPAARAPRRRRRTRRGRDGRGSARIKATDMGSDRRRRAPPAAGDRRSRRRARSRSGSSTGTVAAGTRRVDRARRRARRSPTGRCAGGAFSLRVDSARAATSTVRVTAVDGAAAGAARRRSGPSSACRRGAEPRLARRRARPGARAHGPLARAPLRRHERRLRPGPRAPGAAPPGTRGRASRPPRRSSSRSRSPSCAPTTACRPPGSRVDALLRAMLVALRQRRGERARGLARRLDVRRLGARERDAARARAARLADVRRLRATERRAAGAPIPIRVEQQPALRRRQVHDRLGPRAARARGLARRRRHRARCRALGVTPLGGALPALAAGARRATAGSSTASSRGRRRCPAQGGLARDAPARRRPRLWPGGVYVAAVLTWNAAASARRRTSSPGTLAGELAQRAGEARAPIRRRRPLGAARVAEPQDRLRESGLLGKTSDASTRLG